MHVRARRRTSKDDDDHDDQIRIDVVSQHQNAACARMLAVEYPLVRASIRAVERAQTVQEEQCHRDRDRDRLPCIELDALKARVPIEKERVGPRMWEHRINRAPIATGSRNGLKTRAYHKLKEILLSCAIDPPSMSVHLCEAPGAFVLATAEAVAPSAAPWTWIAFTLLDVHAPVPMHELPMESGRFVYCDVRDYDKCVAHIAHRGTACLVTADGATDMDHANIEDDHIELVFAQTRVAVFCLRKGGTYVLKFFEGRARHTRKCIAWLTTVFDGGVSIIKPTSSRPTNSERYLVARGFVGGKVELPQLHTLVVADEWYADVDLVVDCMLQEQIKQLRHLLRS